jgi:hypothetical protein
VYFQFTTNIKKKNLIQEEDYCLLGFDRAVWSIFTTFLEVPAAPFFRAVSRWKLHIPLKCWQIYERYHAIIFQKPVILTVTTVKTSNLIF